MKKKESNDSKKSNFQYFFLHLLILCGFYSNLSDVIQSPLMNGAKPSSIVLFIHILTLLIYPALLILLTRASGYTILNMIPQLEWNNEDMRVRWPIETSI